MRIALVVNDAAELVPTMTTAMLAHAVLRRGHELCVVDVLALELAGAVVARARVCPAGGCDDEIDAALARIARASVARVELDRVDAVLLRTNPARDPRRAWAHAALMDLARVLRDRGVVVQNDPDGLARTASKLSLARLPPRLVPPTAATRDPEVVRAWARRCGRCVIKPARGTRGHDVYLIDGPDDPTIADATSAAGRDGLVLVQPYLLAAAAGDVRVVVLDGALLEVDGHLAAIRRVPAPGEFRSNLHQGGRPAPAGELSAVVRAGSIEVAGILAREGIALAGLDWIGDHLIEANVHSTGGLHAAVAFTGADFPGAVIAALERRVEAARAGHPATGNPG